MRLTHKKILDISVPFPDSKKCLLLLPFFLIFFSLKLIAQNKDYSQISNELQFSKTINDKWTAQVWLGNTFSNTPTENNILKTSIQKYFIGWADYYYSSRWKFSAAIAHYDNKDVPDIGQYYSPEWRLTLQGIYYFHKLGYTLATRMRGEFRQIMDENGVYQDKFRYRQLLKYQKPINGKVLREGIFYGFTSEEIFLRGNTKSTPLTFFDRNRFELGGGYMINDDTQLELTYSNEFLPRDHENEIYNALTITLSFNNLLSNLKKKMAAKKTADKKPD